VDPALRAQRGCDGPCTAPETAPDGWTRCPWGTLLDDPALSQTLETWRQWRIERGQVLPLGEMPAPLAEAVVLAEQAAVGEERAQEERHREVMRAALGRR